MTIEYNFETKINGKVIHCRAFTLGEYLDLIKAKAAGNIKPVVQKILNDCTDAKGLLKHESELLLIRLWAQSLGEVSHTATYVCDCGNEIPTPINLTYAGIVGTGELLYQLSGFKVKFKYPKMFDDENIGLMIASCIEYIIVNGEQIFVDDLNETEIQDLYSAITTEDVKNITDMLLEPTIQLAVPIACSCGKNHVQTITGLKEFFRIIQ